MRTKRWAFPTMAFALSSLTIILGWLGRDSLATRLQLEALVSIVALTTFLVGFSTVRIQTRLEEHRASLARLTDRVVEANNRDDMLPLPTELRKTKDSEDFDARDRLALLTEFFSIFNFAVSVALVFFHWRFFELFTDDKELRYSYIGYVLILAFHLFVVLLGRFASFETNQQVRTESYESVFERYEDLEKHLEIWLQYPEVQKVQDDVLKASDRLDVVLPGWTWLTLIRGSLQDERSDRSSLKRILAKAQEDKDRDDYSLIAYVWSAYLVDSLGASVLVRLNELRKIGEFEDASKNSGRGTNRLFARLALREVKEQLKRDGRLPNNNGPLDELLEKCDHRSAPPKDMQDSSA